MDDNVQEKIDEMRRIKPAFDCNSALSELKSKYRILNYYVSQLSSSQDVFNQNTKELTEEILSIYELWDSITKNCKPVPMVLIKEFEKVRSECLIALDFYVKFKELLFLK